MHKKHIDEKRKKKFEANWYWYLTGEMREGMSKEQEFMVRYLS